MGEGGAVDGRGEGKGRPDKPASDGLFEEGLQVAFIEGFGDGLDAFGGFRVEGRGWFGDLGEEYGCGVLLMG